MKIMTGFRVKRWKPVWIRAWDFYSVLTTTFSEVDLYNNWLTEWGFFFFGGGGGGSLIFKAQWNPLPGHYFS